MPASPSDTCPTALYARPRLDRTYLASDARMQLTVGEIVDVVLQVCEARARGAVHRDVRPAIPRVAQHADVSRVRQIVNFGAATSALEDPNPRVSFGAVTSMLGDPNARVSFGAATSMLGDPHTRELPTARPAATVLTSPRRGVPRLVAIAVLAWVAVLIAAISLRSESSIESWWSPAAADPAPTGAAVSARPPALSRGPAVRRAIILDPHAVVCDPKLGCGSL